MVLEEVGERFTTLLCVSGLAPLAAFNLDVARPCVTPEGGKPFVLSSLLHQDPSTNKTWLLVTSPRTSRTSGPLHRCSCTQDEILCQPVEHAPFPKRKHRGVTVVRSHQGVLICIQVLNRQPHSLNSELTGTCSLLAPDLRPQAQTYFSDLESLLDPDSHVDAGDCYRNKKSSTGEDKNTARQRRDVVEEEEEEEEEEEAGEKRQIWGTEIAIILDGSGSIDPPDFQRAKDFISNMMRSIYEKCFECSFALVQYGEVIQTEFDLQDSQDVMASLARVQNITQVGNVTKTASAIQHVLDNIFTPSHGSREKASKVMVVLTDGDIFGDPLNLTTVINSPKMLGVERFAIGVGDAFKNDKTDRELKLIASDPDETHAFKVTNYTALDGLRSKLQQNIIRMEGTVGDALHYQLAQIGFSAQILEEGQVLLGAVGAFDWSGGALLYNMHSRRGRFLNRTANAEAAQYGYLGYSVAVLHKACGLSYIAGAPRHKQHGAVFELQKEGREAAFVPVLEGEQMGSYFGSELCPVDINMDGTTDLLLVAAPFYHVHREEGRVYVYRLNEQDGSFSLAHMLSGHPGVHDARFGFAMAAVGDISQDKLTDVAIGAPLEDFGADGGTSFGSVYIYNGRWDGLSTIPSQRIRASAVAPGLYYFGVSVAGGLDFSGDGLADITVGTLGRAAVLRSRPVVHLKVSMTFTPSALPIGFNSTVNVHLCFEINSATTATESGLRETSLNFSLDVDVMKQKKRLQCSDVGTCLSHLREWSSGARLCERLLLIPTQRELCEEDCFSNISVKVRYQLQNPKGWRDHPHPILDLYTEPSAVFQLPYEKACKNKLFCVAELQLATTISQQEVIVGLTKELTMNISLTNSGEDSYMTSMALNYPRNLQFKRIQKPPSLNIQCDDPKPVASVLVMNCKIGHPILKRSSANVSVVWQLEKNAFPNRTADITVIITNSNERRSLARETCSLQFRHAFIAVLSKPSVMYMNTSRGLSDHKEFFFSIHGENLFGAEFQLQICVPIKLHGFQIVRVKNLTNTQAYSVCTQSQERACGSDPVQHVEEWHSVSCAITSDKENVTVAAEISLGHSKQLLRDITELQILGEISFNKYLYEGLNAENHRTQITVIFLKNEEYHSLLIIIGSSVGGLLVLIVIIVILFKCGFFKRKYQQLNLENIRKAQLKSENLLTEENYSLLPHPLGESINQSSNF
ncbi:PREDICTED: integrin alpha-E [Galeopterus variegatus]|uniref:Integrin alpha-E n=1 Tax=Galeopterus variegatus TaxID=482537 RepID=A0ABM0QFX3_GALVR|nr:PREDICTED: integrin alpha-E [Galeopterus variegatus]